MALQSEVIVVTPFYQNCTLLWDDETNEAVLIDVGGDVLHILEEVARRELVVKATWLTHGHLDHVGGVVELVHNNNDIVILGPHIEDEFLLDSLPQTTAQYGFPVSPAFKPTHWLEEGEFIQVGNHQFKVLHIPGHTPGHVVFYCATSDLLIAGDTLFYETVGRTDFPYGSHEDLIQNICIKLLVLPEQTKVITGHGRMTTIGHEKQHNPFF